MRSRSLFWTFAGVFLAVLVVATTLQVFFSAAVLRPLATQNARQQAELTIDRVSRRLAVMPADPGPADIIPLLRENTPEEHPEILVFGMHDGPVVPDRRLGASTLRAVALLLAKEGLADTAMALSLPPPGPNGPGPRDGGFGPPEARFGPRPGRPSRARPPRDGLPGVGPPRDGPPRDRARGGGPPNDDPSAQGPPDGRRGDPVDSAPRFELLAHRAVTRDGLLLGELAVVAPAPGLLPWSLPGSRSLLLFLPLAVLVSGAAALLMVRLLVRRLRALERVAGRVIEGDLDARVEERGLDEIGRLEERFNHMTARLAAARAQLEETDRQRRTLLADITHELATPLTSIRGYVETLLDPAVQTTPEERTAYLKDVLEESKRLDLMIGELFELARLEDGATPLQRVRLDWNALCRNTARRLEPRFREVGLELITTGAAVPMWVRADGRRIEQVVENLLVNALRYVPSGGHVWIALDRVATTAPDTGALPVVQAAPAAVAVTSAAAPSAIDETAPAARWRLAVSDDGPGIAEADLSHVFERFYRAETVRAMGGTGLGLAIVREIVRQHGGDVSVERNDPRGAKFLVELVAELD